MKGDIVSQFCPTFNNFRLLLLCVSLPENLFIDSKGIVVKKWRVACQHLIEEDAEGPPAEN